MHKGRSVANTGRRALSRVPVHNGMQNGAISKEISTKRVTFGEPGKVPETDTSVGDLGLSDSSSYI